MSGRILILAVLIVLTGCYRGPYQLAYAGNGDFKQVGQCLLSSLKGQGPEATTWDGHSTSHQKHLDETRQLFVITTYVPDHKGVSVIGLPFYGTATAGNISIKQRGDDAVFVFVDHKPDWSWAAYSGLSDLQDEYIWDCLPNAKQLGSR